MDFVVKLLFISVMALFCVVVAMCCCIECYLDHIYRQKEAARVQTVALATNHSWSGKRCKCKTTCPDPNNCKYPIHALKPKNGISLAHESRRVLKVVSSQNCVGPEAEPEVSDDTILNDNSSNDTNSNTAQSETTSSIATASSVYAATNNKGATLVHSDSKSSKDVDIDINSVELVIYQMKCNIPDNRNAK